MVNLLEIETSRLRLRPCREDDIDDLHRLWIDPQVRKYLWDDTVITREQAAEVVSASLESFERHGFGQWVVFLKEEISLIGFCGFRLFDDPPEVEILYGIAPEYWGEGLATEAAKAMIRCGFEEHSFERIFA
ncbi:MAG: GNAT family N-acetyltransferase [Blastocatellia bacterium]|nr:GNAT family N-acetyltransferase [Blastocatellia bacterium]